MELPQPPPDPELKTIIDKLANFVARNGPDFEQMTKNKQRDNPKFSFLYGGENFNYYQFKVTTEQAIINQQKQKLAAAHAQQTLNQSSSPWKQNEAILLQIAALQEEVRLEELNVQTQITQSEQNLSAQYTSLTQTQQYQVDDLVTRLRRERVEKLSQQCAVSVADFNNVLQAIIDSCTKDAISNGKNWIFNRATSYIHFDFIASHLLNRILDRDSTFDLRLHLIYLINDLLHHSQRKGIDQMKMTMARIVVPAFCTAISGVDELKRQKLDKLLCLWRKNGYFDMIAFQKMADPVSALADYQASCVSEHSALISTIAATIQQQYSALQLQHKEYSEHLTAQLHQTQMQLQQMQTQQQALATIIAANTINTSIPPPGLLSVPPMLDPPAPNQFPPFRPPSQLQFDPSRPPPNMGNLAEIAAAPIIPDMSRPPPGFPEPIPPPQPEVNLIPSVPYYDLPAGLMCPLVKMEDHEYTPIRPEKMRLPPPAPPTEKLLAAVEAFYSAPSHDSPRDGKGWERLGLYEYYKAKDAAKKRKAEERAKRSRSRSKSESPSPEHSPPSRSRSPSPVHRRRSASRSPSPKHNVASRHRSKSPPRRSKSRTKSRSPSVSPDRPYQIATPINPNDPISEQNKGHMLMKKMGWSGRGLGATEQGMVDPIQGGEARDKIDMYKGIGMDIEDPFEQFRKKNSSGYINKLRL